ncbi:transcriptional regulator, TetR family [Frankia torreyi]|uniref:Transcriptional regulator, TetR family n=2 Tax=Frankia TaxID=1854 RepID=A0A0D8B8U1_9ACTN|nr:MULTISPECIES: TetR/AcrR family transcriptional regulator [Frankia]KJE19782.1 transcriptional regulator, TetR family [Frankia torreyi]KQC35891.1 TetR family transcriptional regulator [Frankia sp. ACN1ag]
MDGVKLSRRERLRVETVRDIKEIALRHMAEQGAAGLSLRAIAREMGMTAGALYSYYDTRDDLITALIVDVYDSLAQALEAARRSRPDDPAGQLEAVGVTYREWAIGRSPEFQLVYGDPIPGYKVRDDGAELAAEHRACGVLIRIVAAAWPGIGATRAAAEATAEVTTGGPARPAPAAAGSYTWSDFRPDFAAMARTSFPDFPPDAAALSLRIWGRLHGLVALEVYGHLRPQVNDPARLYGDELRDLCELLNLTPSGAPTA